MLYFYGLPVHCFILPQISLYIIQLFNSVDKITLAPAHYSALHSSCFVVFEPCLDNICENNASCIQHVETVTCECPDGYEGSLCEERR